MGKQSNKKRNPFVWILLIGGLLLIGYAGYVWFSAQKTPPVPPAPSSQVSEAPAPASSVPEQPEDPLAPYTQVTYPVGKLIQTQDRLAYTPGELLLEVPRLALEAPVLSGGDDETLTGGVGLYDYGQLPGEGNRNVSIAGHRDIHGQEFLKIETVTEGDLMYLTYEGKRYTYEYVDTEIVTADNWDPIRVKEYNALTLTSCDPIGTSLNRIIVTGRLIAVEDVTEQAGSDAA